MAPLDSLGQVSGPAMAVMDAVNKNNASNKTDFFIVIFLFVFY
jgi:hypothetical protein